MSADGAAQPERRRGRPPAARSRDTRARILAAARQSFARLGYREATNRQIAQLAGVTPSALYNHFPAKPQLYYAVLEDAEETIAGAIAEAVSDGAPLRAQFRAILEAFADLHERDPSLAAFGAGISLESMRHPEIQALLEAPPQRIYTQFERLIVAATERGEINATIPTEQLMQAILVLTTGLSWSALRHRPEEHRALLATLGQILEGALLP